MAKCVVRIVEPSCQHCAPIAIICETFARLVTALCDFLSLRLCFADCFVAFLALRLTDTHTGLVTFSVCSFLQFYCCKHTSGIRFPCKMCFLLAVTD